MAMTKQTDLPLQSMKIKLILSEPQINRIIKQVDTDGDGVVDIHELNEIIEKFENKGIIYKALSERSKIRNEFQKYDTDKSLDMAMDVMILKFPLIAENVFKELDNKTMTNCKQVSRFWNVFLDEKKVPRGYFLPQILKFAFSGSLLS